MPDIDWLIKKGFRHIGGWSNPHTKPKWSIRPEPTRGIYAFVVEGKVRYIGKATSLRHRIREYNRSLAPETPRRFRKVHTGMQQTWMVRQSIDVWVYDFGKTKDGSLIQLETRWIGEKSPEWNG